MVAQELDAPRVAEIQRDHTARANRVAEETLRMAKAAMKLEFGPRQLQ